MPDSLISLFVMIIDSHVHLYHRRFDDDRNEVILRAKSAGVEVMIMPAIDVASIGAALKLCEEHTGLYAMAAIHPSDVKGATDADMDQVEQYCQDPRVVAVGESGLDYYWDRSFDEKQHDFFRRHIRLAIRADLPLIIHNREATDDVIRILAEERAASDSPERMRGIFHCFGGPADVIPQVMQLGFYFGIGGTVTYKNSGVADVVAQIPMDRIVVETDAPFLAPVPHRGKRNEPSFTVEVVERVAAAKGVAASEVAEATTTNSRALFGV